MNHEDERASAFDIHEAPTLPRRKRAACLSVVDPLVLVAEDDEDLRALYCSALNHLGYRTIDRENGEQAIEAARTLRPHALLTDIAMPKLDGIDLTRQIKADEAMRATFVVVMTALGGARFVEATQAGCSAFLCKPFNPFVLDEILGAHFALRTNEVIKRCGCGREYTRSEWKALTFCGTMGAVELRNCVCGSTVALADGDAVEGVASVTSVSRALGDDSERA